MVMARTNKVAVLNLLIIAATVTALIVISTFNSSFEDDLKWSKHTYEVRKTISSLSTCSVQAQNSNRSFLLTGNPIYSHDRENSRIASISSLNQVEELTKDNPTQQGYIQKMRAQLKTQHCLMDELAQNPETGSLIFRDRLLKMRDFDLEFQALIQASRDEEDRLMVERSSRLAENNRKSMIWLAIVCMIDLILSFLILGFLPTDKIR